MQECFDDFSETCVREAVPGCPVPRDGCSYAPDKPGLGIELNDELIKVHPYQERFFNLWNSDWHLSRRLFGSMLRMIVALPLPDG